MIPDQLRDILYVISAVLFILDLKWMSHPRTAVRGNAVGALGMALAIIATIFSQTMDWRYVMVAAAVGTLIGAVSAMRVKMTAMPEMVGLFNGFGGGASVLVAGSALLAAQKALAAGGGMDMQEKIATVLSAIIGSGACGEAIIGAGLPAGVVMSFSAVRKFVLLSRASTRSVPSTKLSRLIS